MGRGVERGTVRPSEGEIARLEGAVLLSPGNGDAWGHLAQAYALAGSHEVAASAAAEAVRLAPDDAIAHHRLGVALVSAGKPSAALRHLEEAVRLDPDRPAWLAALGRTLVRVHQDARAAAILRQAIGRDPDLEEARVTLGSALCNEGRFAEAIPVLEEAAFRQPWDGDLWASLVFAYGSEGRGDDAADAFRLALAAGLRGAPAAGRAGVGLEEARRYEDAEEAFRLSIEIDPRFHGGHLGLGRVALLRDRPEEALLRLRRAVCLGPEDPDSWTLLDFAHNAIGDRRAGLEACRQRVRLAPWDAEGRWRLGLLLHLNGRNLDAAKVFAHLLQIEPPTAGAHFGLGLALNSLPALSPAE